MSVDLRELTAQEQEAALRGGLIDVGLLLLPVRDPALASLPLWRQPLVAALPAEHPLAAREELEIGDLRDEPFVFFPRHLRATYFDQVMRWCAGAGFTPGVVQEAIEIPTLLSLVAAGVGVFLPIEFFSRLALPGVVYRPVRGAPVVEIVAAWPRAGQARPTVQAFLEVAQGVLSPSAAAEP